MKVLDKELVELRGIRICFDIVKNYDTIVFDCDKVSSTGREVTKLQLESILKLLYDVDVNVENIINKKRKILKKTCMCQMLFSDEILIAISNEKGKEFCYFETGQILSEMEIFNICKLRMQKNILSEIKDLEEKIEGLMIKYEEIDLQEYK